MPKAYLTIDDGPSVHFETLVDFLAARNIPAVFFNRGDHMEARPEAVIYGIRKGYIMANHAYSHRRFSGLSMEECKEEILRTEAVLEGLYNRAGVERTQKYFRFPYMDRGMGSYLVKPEEITAEIESLIRTGLGHKISEFSGVEKKDRLQSFLKEQGFDRFPAPDVTLPWYGRTEMARAVDSLCTFSTSDWVLNERHRGKFNVHTQADLQAFLEQNPAMQEQHSAHIILAHDGKEIHESTCGIIAYLHEKNFEFLTI